MADLSTTYLGLELRSPLVASASPLTGSLDRLLELEEAGAGAVVLPSLFEEQLALEQRLALTADTANLLAPRNGDAVDLEGYNAGPGEYLRLVQRAGRRLAIPVIASLNCARTSSWPEFTRALVAAGADAIELNVHLLSADPARSSGAIEDEYVSIVTGVVEASSVPVAVKLAPFLTAPVHLAARLEAAGASGLVLFHRLHQPDVDIPGRATRPHLERSTPAELGVRLRWLGILRDRVGLSLAATGGIWRGDDAVKAILAGADVTMVASVLLERGPQELARLTTALDETLDLTGLGSVRAARGLLSSGSEGTPSSAERAAYFQALLGAAARR